MVRVLIVDDEAPLVRNLTSYLSSFAGEFAVATATAAEEALAALAAGPVDVLLTDVRLPGMDGIELLRRSFELQPKIKGLVMTAFASAELRHQAIGEGALRFIEKPLDLAELREALHEVTRAGGGWTGQLGELDPFVLTQLLMFSGKDKVIRVQFRRDRGVLRIADGALVHASTQRLRGDEAFYQMHQWHDATFEPGDVNGSLDLEPNITLPFNHLVMETARLTDELNRVSEHFPGRTAPLYRKEGPAPAADDVGCGAATVLAAIECRPGVSCAELEESLPLASVKVATSVAFLCHAGVIAAAEPPVDEPPPAARRWWSALCAGYPAGVKLLVVGTREALSVEMGRSVARLAEELGAGVPRFTPDPDGPTMVRLHTAEGGPLSLTFLPLQRKLRFLFETFAATSHLVLFQNAGGGDTAEWRRTVPAGVRCGDIEATTHGPWNLTEALRDAAQAMQVTK